MKKTLLLSITLVFLGLHSFSQWRNLNPHTDALFSVSFPDANTGYAVGSNGKILKTSDAGITWTPQSSGTTNTLSSVYFTDANTGYAVGYHGSILKTINGGTTWTTLSGGYGYTFTSVYFTDSNTGYAAKDGSRFILITTDGGTTWTEHWAGSYIESIYFCDVNTGYAAGCQGNISKTTDGGNTWTSLSSGVLECLHSVYFSSASNGFAVGFNGIILKTSNGGNSWTHLYYGTVANLNSVYFSNTNTGYAVGDDGIILKTSDGGNTWTTLSSGTITILNSVYFTDANNGHAVGDDGTILKTSDGGTNWNEMGRTNSDLNSICFPNANNGYAVGEGVRGSVLKTYDGGITWSVAHSFESFNLYSVFFTNTNTGFTTSRNGYIFKTNDGGITWGHYNSVTNYNLNSIYFPVANTGYAVGDLGTIVKTTNGGSSMWTVLSSPTSVQLNSVYFTDNNTGYIAGNDGVILKTINGGTSWAFQPSGTTNELISVYFSDANTGYISGENGMILKTNNAGNTWTALTSGTTSDLYSIYFTGSNTGYAVGSNGTIIKTSDTGTTWRAQSSGTTNKLSSVYFTNANMGYIVGDQGTILKTITGGELVPPILTTTIPYAITATTAVSGGNITFDGYAPVTARGVCVALWEYPDITDGDPTFDGTGSGVFVSNITALSPATNYHVRAYATNSAGTSYGNDIAFTTPCPPSYSLPFGQGFGTGEQPACWTQVDHQGNGQVWQFGVIQGWDPEPNLNYNYAYLNSGAYGTGGNQNADLITPLLDLSGYTSVTLGFNHFFRSFFGSSGKVSYSINNGTSWTTLQTYTSTTANPAVFSMTIPAAAGQSQVKFKWNYTGGNGYYWAIDDVQITGLPFVTTATPTSVTTTTAISGGTINPGGGATYTARGVCWGETVNPVVSGSHTTDGSGTGPFISTITGLSPGTSYHVRAYATSSSGTMYGNDISFTTLCTAASLPFSEGFASASLPNCWYQSDHQGYGQLWQFGTISGYGANNPALTGNYAYLNSDLYGDGNTQDVDLVSPLFDLSSYSAVVLGFNHAFKACPESFGTLFYSIDNGSNWYPIQFFYESTTNPAAFSQAIPGVAGQSQVRFKWNYFGTFGWYWAIDDIHLTVLQPNRELTNITVGSGTTSCYNALQTITVAGSGTIFTVQNGGDVTLVAGEKILFEPGTTVQPGGHLWGYITTNGTYCINPNAPVNPAPIEESVPAASETGTTLFRVYPNPTTGKFTLELNAEPKDIQVNVRIYGMLGEEVLHENLAGNRKTEFSLSERSNGIYIIRVIMGDRMASAKIIKRD